MKVTHTLTLGRMFPYLPDQFWNLLPAPIATSRVEKIEIMPSFLGIFILWYSFSKTVRGERGLPYTQHLAIGNLGTWDFWLQSQWLEAAVILFFFSTEKVALRVEYLKLPRFRRRHAPSAAPNRSNTAVTPQNKAVLRTYNSALVNFHHATKQGSRYIILHCRKMRTTVYYTNFS